MSQQATEQHPITADNIEVFTEEEFQQQQAGRIEKEIFENEKNAEKTGGLISDFVASYEAAKNEKPLEQWLTDEFRKYPTAWQDETEITDTAREIIVSIQRSSEAKDSLYAQLDAGKSKESWLAQRIELGAAAAGVSQVGAYSQNIDEAVRAANEGMLNTISNQDGSISAALNLDGFIAEQHHVDSFNLEAAAQGSPFRAKALVPDGTTYAKNSMDIGIYDGNGKLVRRYQVKYGQDADATGKLFDKGDYRGQTKVVPEGQAEQISGARDTIEHEGIRSKPLSKEQAKALQERAQHRREAKQYDWNDVNRINIAKNLGKQALIGAGITAAMHGGRILSRRIWNSLTGKENRPASEDLKEFFNSSIKSGKHVGVQVAVSGALVVAVKNGWLGKALRGTPAGTIANIAHIGMENAKIIYKFFNGEVTGPEALDAMGNVTCSTLGGLAGAGVGMLEGAAIGALLGPVGAVVGGFVGGVVGGMAGSKIGDAVYTGGKAIVKTAVSVVKTVANGIKETAKAVGRVLNPMNWFA